MTKIEAGQNYLETAEANRPDLPTRERAPGKIQAQCPGCDQWRPAFCVTLTKHGWRCDGCISRRRREQRE